MGHSVVLVNDPQQLRVTFIPVGEQMTLIGGEVEAVSFFNVVLLSANDNIKLPFQDIAIFLSGVIGGHDIR